MAPVRRGIRCFRRCPSLDAIANRELRSVQAGTAVPAGAENVVATRRRQSPPPNVALSRARDGTTIHTTADDLEQAVDDLHAAWGGCAHLIWPHLGG